MDIPKIIHQIWIGPKKRPMDWIETFSTFYINENPDWEYILWDEGKIRDMNLFANFPDYELIYNAEKTFNGKSDILRYIILYKYGGIYVDADSVWINNKSFDTLINQVNDSGVFIGYENETKKTVCGGVMGSTKNNKLMLKLILDIENLAENWKGKNIKNYTRRRNLLGPSNLLGPGHIQKNLVDDNENVTIFPTIYFYPISWHGIKDGSLHKKIKLPKESYTFQYGYTTNDFDKL